MNCEVFLKSSNSENHLRDLFSLGAWELFQATIPSYPSDSTSSIPSVWFEFRSRPSSLDYTNMLIVAQLVFLRLFYPPDCCLSDLSKHKITEINIHLNKRPAWLTSAHWIKFCSQHGVRTSTTRLQPLASSTFLLPFQAPLSSHSKCRTAGLVCVLPPLPCASLCCPPGLHEVLLFTIKSQCKSERSWKPSLVAPSCFLPPQ